MGKALSETVEILGIKGINQQERLADPTMELYDARNLWAPDGRLEKRPGFWGVGSSNLSTTSDLTGFSSAVKMYVEDPVGTFTETSTISALGVGERFYFKWTDDDASLFSATKLPTGLGVVMTNVNTNDISAFVEYWNGATWAPLNVAEIDDPGTGYNITAISFSKTENVFIFPWPNDITVSGSPYGQIRFTIQAKNGTSALVTPTTVNRANCSLYQTSLTVPYSPLYYMAVPFLSGLRYIAGYRDVSTPTNGASIQSTRELAGPATGAQAIERVRKTDIIYTTDVPASIAIVPAFGEFYVAYNRIVTAHKSVVLSAADCASLATVETDPEFIGPNEQYGPAFVPQLASWPRAQHIAFHRGEMWAANLKDGGEHSIRWSAGAPAYKVWPTISIETLTDVDNSPISALFAYDQDMIVFKNSSIWRMVYTGLNGLKLNSYRAEKIVSGIGCGAHQSIQDINGNLVFLAEDGVYVFNGVKAEKISSRIQKIIDSISPGRRALAVSTHWKAKSCYLLAVTTSGSDTNNLVLVWDYKNDSWWVWDNIEAGSFFGSDNDVEAATTYFTDAYGQVFQLGVGQHDYGTAISAYYVSQRLNQANVNQKIRAVTFLGTNHTREIDVEVQPNDQPFLGKDVQTVTFKDSNEKEYGTAQYDVSHYSPERERYAGLGELKSGSWFRLKVSHDLKDHPLQLANTQINVVPTGVRR